MRYWCDIPKVVFITVMKTILKVSLRLKSYPAYDMDVGFRAKEGIQPLRDGNNANVQCFLVSGW